jgi:diacylglycerol kinase (ATP)
MTPYTFIVNPSAGKGAGGLLLDPLQNELRSRRISHDIVLTSGPGHATQAARESLSTTVVAVGGDGTINEVANGLPGTEKMMGIIPAGSGNDFVKSVSIPSRLAPALDVLLRGTHRSIDLGTVATGDGNSLPRSFVNGVGVGFDAAVAAKTREIKSLSGIALYLAAVFQTLGHYVAPTFTISMGASPPVIGRNLLIAIGNGVCAGGGFFLTPDAKVDDGLLDACVVDDKNFLEILWLMPRVILGKHHNVTGVNFHRDKNFAISASEPFFVHADGEIVGTNVTSVRIGIQPAALRIIA